MLSLPTTFISVMVVFASVFSKPDWQHVKVLPPGAILASGRRTVASVLWVMGLSTAPHFQNYHRVLNRAAWSPLTASRLLLRLLVAMFAPWGIVVCGLDDTIERRRGDYLRANGIFRDPVCPSHSHVVNGSGWRWLCCMLLTPMAWAGRVWARPGLWGGQP
jgi:DDE superfamily endonuclease